MNEHVNAGGIGNRFKREFAVAVGATAIAVLGAACSGKGDGNEQPTPVPVLEISPVEQGCNDLLNNGTLSKTSQRALGVSADPLALYLNSVHIFNMSGLGGSPSSDIKGFSEVLQNPDVPEEQRDIANQVVDGIQPFLNSEGDLELENEQDSIDFDNAVSDLKVKIDQNLQELCPPGK